MWLIVFTPNGTNAYIPQFLCETETQAGYWLTFMPKSPSGIYSYVYVPVVNVKEQVYRQEPWMPVSPNYWPPKLPSF